MGSINRTCLVVMTGALDLSGGIAVANRSAIYALLDGGYQLTIMALSEDSTSSEKYAGLPNVCYEGYGGNKPRFAFAVWKILLYRHFSLIFVDHVNLASLLFPLALIKLVRYTVRLNGIEVFPPRPDLEGWIGLRFAQHRLAISGYTARIVRKQFPKLIIEQCDLSLAPNQDIVTNLPSGTTPVSLITVEKTVQRLGNTVLLHVGRMVSNEKYKGQDTLLLAMPLILAHHPNTQLVLVGQGNDFSRLEEIACSLPTDVQQSIFMPGFVTDELLERLYAQCFAFVMPSWGEGFGLVYIEAMRWGKPCLGSSIDAAQSIIRDGETGILVNDPQNYVEVAERLMYLLNNPDIAHIMGETGQKLVAAHYSFHHFKSRFLKMLKP